MADLAEQAFSVYQQRDWSTARRLFGELSALQPNNRAAETLLQRISEFTLSAPSDGWDGSYQLTKK